MPLPLPEPDTTQLVRSPLELVVCQVRFDSPAPRTSVEALQFHEILGGEAGRYPRLEPVQALNLSVGLGAPETLASTGWRFSEREPGWAVSLMSDHVSLETQRYETWNDFRQRLGEVIDAITEVVEPTLVLRFGLRYIDRITELNVTSPAGWERYIRPWLLGFVTVPGIGNLIEGAQQQLIISLAEDGKCGLRHGLLPDSGRGMVDYLLDYDLYQQETRRFDAASLKATADVFNRMALQLFQASVTPELLQVLGAAG